MTYYHFNRILIYIYLSVTSAMKLEPLLFNILQRSRTNILLYLSRHIAYCGNWLIWPQKLINSTIYICYLECKVSCGRIDSWVQKHVNQQNQQYKSFSHPVGWTTCRLSFGRLSCQKMKLTHTERMNFPFLLLFLLGISTDCIMPTYVGESKLNSVSCFNFYFLPEAPLDSYLDAMFFLASWHPSAQTDT